MSRTAEVTRQGAATTPQPARCKRASTAIAGVMRSVICSINAAGAATSSARDCEEFGIALAAPRGLHSFGVRVLETWATFLDSPHMLEFCRFYPVASTRRSSTDRVA